MLPEPTAKRGGAGGPAAGADDRLGALPDGLLHAVLSFLPAPQAVRTSVLSRQWRDLWRSAPCINIYELEFGITPWIDQDAMEENWRSSRTSPPICSCSVTTPRRWISSGCMLTCMTIEMSIGGFAVASKLLCSGFPVLEDLEIRKCYTTFQDFRLPTLKKLAIDNCINITRHPRHPLVIMAPDLTSFHLTLFLSKWYFCMQDGFPCKSNNSYIYGILPCEVPTQASW